MAKEKNKSLCGIVMPISGNEECPESHWLDVLDIHVEAIQGAGFEGDLVSNADDVGIIHKRIIQNLYENPIVVCDVSCKNPNVMFELGLRLAFDKPTIIVKDDKTSYTFDTSAIEHLEYPRDLRFSQIVEFKSLLSEKLTATYDRSTSDPNYTTFLKHFGTFHVAKLDSSEVTGDQIILEELQELRRSINVIKYSERQRANIRGSKTSSDAGLMIINAIKSYASEHNLRGKVQIRKKKSDIASYVVKRITAGRYFLTREDYDNYFDELFNAMYD